MAYKKDTFWEDHEPVYVASEADERVEDAGIGAVEASHWTYWVLSALITLPLLAVLMVTIITSGMRSADALFAFVMLCPLHLTFDIYLKAVLQRYRLVDDGLWMEEGPPCRMRPFPMLRRVAGDSGLMARLGPPPESGGPVCFHPDIRGSAAWPLILCHLAAIGIAFIVLLHAGSLLAALYLLVILAPIVRALWLRTRVKASVRALGTGHEPLEDGATTHRFEDVQHAEFRWDAFLFQPYLALDVGGETIRYYNPTDDVLYLLRLVKHRMPDVEVFESLSECKQLGR